MGTHFLDTRGTQISQYPRGRDWASSNKEKKAGSAGKMAPFSKKPTFPIQTCIWRDVWFPFFQFGIQRNLWVSRKVPFSSQVHSSLSFTLCCLFFSSLKHVNCLISLQHQQHVTYHLLHMYTTSPLQIRNSSKHLH